MPLRRWTMRLSLLILGGSTMSVGLAWLCTVVAPFRTGTSRQSVKYIVHRDEFIRSGENAHERITEANCLMVLTTDFGYRQGYIIPEMWSGRATLVEWSDDQYLPHRRATWREPTAWTLSDSEWCEAHAPRWAIAARMSSERTNVYRIAGAGWPMSCVYSVHGRDELRVGLDVNLAHKRLLPVHPLWIGLGVDTAIFAALLGTLFGIAPLRRRLRRARGRCARCAYDLVGIDDACPECGWSRHIKSCERIAAGASGPTSR
jgi:hypothetical protein